MTGLYVIVTTRTSAVSVSANSLKDRAPDQSLPPVGGDEPVPTGLLLPLGAPRDPRAVSARRLDALTVLGAAV